ncbi:tRNA-dihydrouridine synthase, partial [Roseovarius sp. SYSU LYC5161]|uniref:tRNA-dihydrouridine synthase n=1 Tax=Roseovarius halophilus (ex Wu et al. 2025) TaxID=3376060 RepID=UPI003999987D
WLLAEVAAALHGVPAPEVPRGAALADMVSHHYEEMLRFYGRELGCRVARKHLGWYMDGAGTGVALRKRVLTARDPDTVQRLIPDAMTAADRVAA